MAFQGKCEKHILTSNTMSITIRLVGDMDVRFKDKNLDRLETDGRFTAGYSAAIVKAFRKVMQHTRASLDERDLRAWPGAHFEKLAPPREGQYSMRLNDQFRLIVELEGEAPQKVVVIVEIDDYH